MPTAAGLPIITLAGKVRAEAEKADRHHPWDLLRLAFFMLPRIALRAIPSLKSTLLLRYGNLTVDNPLR